jgi:hypothetical protein
VFAKNPGDSRGFHTLQVSLYADYEPEKLMDFLRKAGNYNLQEALAICDKKQLYREAVFLHGRKFDRDQRRCPEIAFQDVLVMEEWLCR